MQLIFKKTKIKLLTNDRGSYGFIELKDFIDYEAKRVYYIYDNHADTGEHCHKIEKELFVMQQGNCVAIVDRGAGKEDIALETGDAIYVGNYIWHGFKKFSAGAILLAVSSTNYSPDRSDYVEDYQEYLKLVNKS